MFFTSVSRRESQRLAKAVAYLCVQGGSIHMLGWPTFAKDCRNPEVAT
jgi:hypothetical protein